MKISHICLFLYDKNLKGSPRLYLVDIQSRFNLVNKHFKVFTLISKNIFNFQTWHEDAANLAQSWAEECKRLTHNRPVDQVYGNCGQNIFVSSAPTSWYERTLHRKQSGSFACVSRTVASNSRKQKQCFFFKGGRGERLAQRGGRLHLRRQQPIPKHRTLHAGGVGHVQQGGLRRRQLQRLAGTVLQLRLQLLSDVRNLMAV
jgi:hypothetical protein